MPVHVSIHDVTPRWEAEVEHGLALCRAIGARPALLVVPDFHGAWPLAAHPKFVARLRALQADGHEIYLHGYTHLARPDAPRTLRWVLAQRVASGGEAEWAELSPAEAESLLDRGLAVLRDLGLRVDGFVAPAWQLPGFAVAQLAARHIEYTEEHFVVRDPVAGIARRGAVLNFASRTAGRLVSSMAWCRAARPLRRVAPARIAIHPADLRIPLLVHETRSLLAWARGDLVATGRALLTA